MVWQGGGSLPDLYCILANELRDGEYEIAARVGA
jgi:hypothetical protein